MPLLLDAKASVNSVDVNGWTALTIATLEGKPEAVKLLLGRGADARLRDREGHSVWMFAAAEGDQDAMAQLLDPEVTHFTKKDLELADRRGWTALHHACAQEHPAVAQMLLEAGADANARDTSGWTPLMLSAESHCYSCAVALTGRGAKVNLASAIGTTPLLLAAAQGDSAQVELLLRRGANPNAASRDKNTALLEAASRGYVEVAQKLLAAGADPNVRTVRGETPLLRATAKASAGNSNAEMIQLLKQAGAR